MMWSRYVKMESDEHWDDDDLPFGTTKEWGKFDKLYGWDDLHTLVANVPQVRVWQLASILALTLTLTLI